MTRQERLIGLMVEPGLPLLVGILGILKAGRGFVPLDPNHPTERLQLMADDCRLRVLLTDRKHLARAQEVAADSAAIEHVVCLDGEAGAGPAGGRLRLYGRSDIAAGQTAEGKEQDGLAAEAIAYVIYTSGSTGTPKGVPITHRHLVPLLLWSREHFGFGEHTRVLQSLSYAFDFGVFEILTTLLFGGTFHPFARQSDLMDYRARVERYGINTLHTTPSFFRAVAATGNGFPDLEILHLGGEALGDAAADQALTAAGARSVLYNGYGPTEATINCAIFTVGTRESRQGRGLPSIPIGRPSAGNVLYVLDGGMQLTPVGVPGELCVGGVGVSRGYLNRPGLTAEKFIPNPFAEPGQSNGEGPGSRLYRTGDRVRFRPDGNLEFLGRRDQQVKIRGYRIELGEIEEALAAEPALRQGAVAAHRTPAGDPYLVAYVVPANGAAPGVDELRQSLLRRLPPYMVPAAFVVLAELPVTASGKLDRRALPAPEGLREQAGSTLPRTPLEELLAGIWCRCLGLERVGIHDDFLALGGHSLLVTQVVAQIRHSLGVEVPLATFFASPTIAELAVAVQEAGHAELPAIRPQPRDGELPLSFAQERIWFLTQLDPNLRSYFVPRALYAEGPFFPALVEAAFSEITRRHEILRTTFPAVDGRPVQVIQPPFRLLLPVVDLSALPAVPREEEMRRRIREAGRRPFDLVRGPLLRLQLLRLAPEEHTLVITEHHLVHDGWTQGVLLRDFLHLYSAFSRGQASPLPELPVQYADFAIWQRLWLRDDMLERQLSYWKERLDGAPALLDLSTDRPRPAVQSFRGTQVARVLPADLCRDLRAASRRLDATLFMCMLSAWDALLMRSGGQEDLCIGTGVANRRVMEVEGLLGMLINTLVLRADLSGAPPFAELVARVRAGCVADYNHQDVPFEKLVAALRLERTLSHTPLFQVFFAFLDTPMPELDLPGLSISVLDAHNGSAKFDINVTVILPAEQGVGLQWVSRPDEITLLFEYNTDLFDPTTVLRMLDHFEVLLEAVVADSQTRISHLPLLTAVEAHQLRAEWNDTSYPESGELCLHELVFAEARRMPGAPAVRCGSEELTYGELARRSQRLAEHLRSRGVGAGDLVGLCLDRSPQMVVALLAVLATGAAYVPLDPFYPRQRLALMVEDARPALLLTEGRLIDALPRDQPLLLVEQVWEELPGVAATARASLDDLAYVLYTSGSTGRPKGVAISHRAVVHFLRAINQRLGLASTDTLLALTTLSFDISVLEIFLPLTVGASTVVATREEARDGARLQTALADAAVTVVQGTPSTWRLLLESGWEGKPRLKILCGGEALPWELADRLTDRCSELWNLYGPTETTVWSTAQQVTPGRSGAGTVPLGRPLGNTDIRLLDRDLGLAPIGVPGELWIGGAGLARGYWSRPDRTALAFCPDPFATEPGARLYRTGDLARRQPGGGLEFLGRLDHQVKLQGHRIELGEIEALLLAHPAIDQAAVVVRQEGTGARRIAAYVTADRERVSNGELREHLKRHLPDYMMPASFVLLDAMPLTPAGKIDRRSLDALAGETPLEEGVGFLAPRTPVESVLATMWSQLLGVERIGVHYNFFDLGGHSLLATQLLARVRGAFQVEIPLRRLYATPTVAELAQAITAEEARPGVSERIARLLTRVQGLSGADLAKELQTARKKVAAP